MNEAVAKTIPSFSITKDGWMFVKVSSVDWHRLCPSCLRAAKDFVAWMLHPPSYGVCIDCYEKGVREGYR